MSPGGVRTGSRYLNRPNGTKQTKCSVNSCVNECLLNLSFKSLNYRHKWVELFINGLRKWPRGGLWLAAGVFLLSLFPDLLLILRGSCSLWSLQTAGTCVRASVCVCVCVKHLHLAFLWSAGSLSSVTAFVVCSGWIFSSEDDGGRRVSLSGGKNKDLLQVSEYLYLGSLGSCFSWWNGLRSSGILTITGLVSSTSVLSVSFMFSVFMMKPIFDNFQR